MSACRGAAAVERGLGSQSPSALLHPAHTLRCQPKLTPPAAAPAPCSYLAEAAADPTAAGAARPPLRSVPSSRAEVFKDRQLSPLQKRALMRFLKAAGEALEGQGPLKVG